MNRIDGLTKTHIGILDAKACSFFKKNESSAAGLKKCSLKVLKVAVFYSIGCFGALEALVLRIAALVGKVLPFVSSKTVASLKESAKLRLKEAKKAFSRPLRPLILKKIKKYVAKQAFRHRKPLAIGALGVAFYAFGGPKLVYSTIQSFSHPISLVALGALGDGYYYCKDSEFASSAKKSFSKHLSEAKILIGIIGIKLGFYLLTRETAKRCIPKGLITPE